MLAVSIRIRAATTVSPWLFTAADLAIAPFRLILSAPSWGQEKGWERLWRYGPREPDSFSRYSNTEDAAAPDAAVDTVVRLIAEEAGHDPDQVTLF